MERLTKKCGDWGYTVPGLNSVVKDNAEIIGEMTNKLAEYENTGLEPKEVEKLKQENIRYMSTINGDLCPKIIKLKHDLAVRDKALELAIKEIAILNNNNVCANKQCSDTNCDYYTETHNCLNMRKKYWLAQAEKKLKGEK